MPNAGRCTRIASPAHPIQKLFNESRLGSVDLKFVSELVGLFTATHRWKLELIGALQSLSLATIHFKVAEIDENSAA